jgi:hypothetical protein
MDDQIRIDEIGPGECDHVGELRSQLREAAWSRFDAHCRVSNTKIAIMFASHGPLGKAPMGRRVSGRGEAMLLFGSKKASRAGEPSLICT